jgi:hypothetical protein
VAWFQRAGRIFPKTHRSWCHASVCGSMSGIVGANVDGAVRSISHTCDSPGRPECVTPHNGDNPATKPDKPGNKPGVMPQLRGEREP